MNSLSNPPSATTLENCELSSLRHTGSHRLCLRFRDDLVVELDFAEYGRDGGPLKRAMQDPEMFGQAFIAYGILSWPNGYDVAPETLRRYAEQGYVG